MANCHSHTSALLCSPLSVFCAVYAVRVPLADAFAWLRPRTESHFIMSTGQWWYKTDLTEFSCWHILGLRHPRLTFHLPAVFSTQLAFDSVSLIAMAGFCFLSALSSLMFSSLMLTSLLVSILVTWSYSDGTPDTNNLRGEEESCILSHGFQYNSVHPEIYWRGGNGSTASSLEAETYRSFSSCCGGSDLVRTTNRNERRA